MIGFALTFIAGMVACCFVPDRFQGWVRGAWGAVWGRVSKRAPAPSSATASLIAAANATTRSAPKVNVAKAAGNVAGAIGKIIGFALKHPMLCLGLAVLAAWMVFGSPFDLGKSKGELRLEREIAEMNTTIAQHEARLAEVSRDLAVNTERDRTRRAAVIAQAEQEIENAAAQVDPDALYRAYLAGYLCVLDASACEGRADPAPSGTPAVRSPGADAA